MSKRFPVAPVIELVEFRALGETLVQMRAVRPPIGAEPISLCQIERQTNPGIDSQSGAAARRHRLGQTLGRAMLGRAGAAPAVEIKSRDPARCAV